MLTTSGNGVVDVALGEECDPLQLPPINADYLGNVIVYDEMISTTDYTLARYPNADAT